MYNFSTKRAKLALAKLYEKRGFVFGGIFGLLLVLGFWFLSDLVSLAVIEQRSGRTNILILGAGGAGHEAAELTDTMIFASLDHQGKNPVLISLPRDIWISSMRAKLNTAYYYGNQKKPGGGIILAKSSVSEILDQPVHYAVTVDFDGFVKIVDLLGGIEVEVQRSFDDYKYPIPGRENDDCGGDPQFLCRYEHIRFETGKQVLNGDRALKFVRSRNAEGDEGTDFARARRQQKVILALRRSIISPKIFLSPPKVTALWRIFAESVETDVPRGRWLALGRLFLALSAGKIRSEVLNGGVEGEEGFLENPPISPKYDNQWVLVPRDGNWDEVKLWVKSLLY